VKLEFEVEGTPSELAEFTRKLPTRIREAIYARPQPVVMTPLQVRLEKLQAILETWPKGTPLNRRAIGKRLGVSGWCVSLDLMRLNRESQRRVL
jgi:hypothetical protein